MISWKEQKLPGKHFFTSITKYWSARKVPNDEEKKSVKCQNYVLFPERRGSMGRSGLRMLQRSRA